MKVKMVAGLLTGLLAAGFVRAEVVSFDNEADLETNFEIIQKGAGGSTEFSAEPGAGGTTGRVDFKGIRGTSGEGLYTLKTFDPDDGPVLASFLFLADEYSSDGGDSRVALGLSAEAKNMVANAEVQARLLKKKDSDRAVFEVRGAKSPANKDGVRLKDSHWYRLSVTFTPYGAMSFEVAAKLEDFGVEGARAEAVVAEISGVRTATKDFFNGKDRLPVRVGALVQSDGGGGRALDDFSIEAGASAAGE